LLNAALIDGFAKRVIRDVEFASDVGFGVSLRKLLLSQLDDFRSHHRSAASATRFVESLDAFGLIFVDTPQHAAFGNSKGLDNVDQFARTLNAELCREHAKASQIPFVMLEDGLRAAEVRPLSILPDDADQITDASGIFRNEW